MFDTSSPQLSHRQLWVCGCMSGGGVGGGGGGRIEISRRTRYSLSHVSRRILAKHTNYLYRSSFNSRDMRAGVTYCGLVMVFVSPSVSIDILTPVTMYNIITSTD